MIPSGEHRTPTRLRRATKDEIAAAEQTIDAAFEAVPLPPVPLGVARWHALTVAEDAMRFWWTTWSSGTSASARLPFFQFLRVADELKYELRHLLQRLDKVASLPPVPYRSPRVVPAAVRPTLDFFDAARAYDGVVRAFTSVHGGIATFLVDAAGRRLDYTPTSPDHLTSGALELLLRTTKTEPIKLPSLTPFSWIPAAFAAGLGSDVVRDIVRSTDARSGHAVAYTYQPEIGRRMFADVAEGAPMELGIPADWIFPWGAADIVSRVLKALHVRCAYHVLAVHFGAVRHRVPGVGANSLCWLVEPHDLVRDVSALAGVTSREAESVLTAVVYGRDTAAPDIALQPLLSAPPTRWIVPPLLTLSGNAGRNALALHARVAPRSFDAQSSSFERDMTQRLVSVVRERYPATRTGVRLAGEASAGEVDLLCADTASRTVLVGELRWMLPPGDANEVVRRIQAARAKVPQVQRKVEAVRRVLSDILDALGQRPGDVTTWRVVGVVVLEGFAGSWSPDAREFPIVPIEVFQLGLRLAQDLGVLHQWLASGTWLPQPEVEYRAGTEDLVFGEWTVRTGTLLPGDDADRWWERIQTEIAAGRCDR